MPETATRPVPAQLAYQAYAVSTGGKTFDGRDMPTWEQLPERIQQAWTAATLAGAEAMIPAYQQLPASVGPRPSKAEDQAHLQDVADYWLPKIKPGGVFDEPALLEVLSSYSHVLTELPKVYCAVTGDRMSKPNYYARDVIAQFEAYQQREIESSILEVLLELYDDLDDEARRILTDTGRASGILDLPKEAQLAAERRADLNRILDQNEDIENHT